MCLTIDLILNKKMVAQEDISCFKVLNNDVKSLYRHEPYTIGEEKETKLGIPSAPDCFNLAKVEEGLHSFKDKETASEFCSNVRVGYDTDTILYDAVIPKGAEYYEGYWCGCRCYTSSRLTVLREVERFFPKRVLVLDEGIE